MYMFFVFSHQMVMYTEALSDVRAYVLVAMASALSDVLAYVLVAMTSDNNAEPAPTACRSVIYRQLFEELKLPV